MSDKETVSPADPASAPDLASYYGAVRRRSEELAAPLQPEDTVVQTMPDVSPTKWHLAHTSWFFETFVLAEAVAGYTPHHPEFNYLFNSYYNAVGAQHPRPQRGLLSRPTLAEVMAYRRHVDEAMGALLKPGQDDLEDLTDVVVLGLNHEQQHQELLLTDIKHVLWTNPLGPVYRETAPDPGPALPLRWIPFEGGLVEVGHEGSGFHYDNEGPRHRHHLEPFELGSRLVTNGEYLEFLEAGSYGDPSLWLSDGWAANQAGAGERSHPLYWRHDEGGWQEWTLGGWVPLDAARPVCHLSYYEADAYASWAGARLPTEEEWEVACAAADGPVNDAGAGVLRPERARAEGLTQLFGDVWEWTRSAYGPYPGFSAAEGALGEYNGKFMCSQVVLRGGSCFTAEGHIRPTYRNFFYPQARWQMTGLRLARSGS